MQHIMEGLVSSVLARWKELGLEEDESKALAEGVGDELRDPNVGGYLHWSFVWAQRAS